MVFIETQRQQLLSNINDLYKNGIYMTPRQKIIKTIMLSNEETEHLTITEKNIEELFTKYRSILAEDINNFHEGEIETQVTPEKDNRYKDEKSVASEMFDGSWVGWTYYCWGGKYIVGKPFEWMNNAYDLDKKQNNGAKLTIKL